MTILAEPVQLDLFAGAPPPPVALGQTTAFGNILCGFAEKMSDHIRAERLHHALAPHAFDGTELAFAIDCVLPGLANASAAVAIKALVKTKYINTIPLDTVIELVLGRLEDGGLV